jgi:Zn-dependent protease
MNILLSMALIAVCRFAGLANLPMVVDVCSQIALLSLFLCFFNLLPIPPLDGSHLLKNAIGMREETFAYLSQFGFVAVIILVNLSVVRNLLGWLTGTTFTLMASMVGL